MGVTNLLKVDVFRQQALPLVEDLAGIVVTGSPAMVSARLAWSEHTAKWLRMAVNSEVPILGVCYGHQLLAHALGGIVGPNPAGRQIGTVNSQLIDNNENQFALVFKQNGVEAINELKQNNKIDFIISEYDLPGNDGLYFFNKINESYGYKKLPFILLVQEYNKSIYQTAFKIGVNDCFVINKVNTIQIANRLKSIENQPIKDILNNNEVNNIGYQLPLSKRIFDIVVASTLLILLLPILLVIIIAIRIESKGKVYYTAKRVGRKTFNFYKLRSMKTGADKQLKDLAKNNIIELQIFNSDISICSC